MITHEEMYKFAANVLVALVVAVAGAGLIFISIVMLLSLDLNSAYSLQETALEVGLLLGAGLLEALGLVCLAPLWFVLTDKEFRQ